MTSFEVLTPDNAPEDAKPFLDKAKADYGVIPNLQGVMALSPQLLKTHLDCLDEFAKTTLTAAEQQVVYLTVNFENNCEYCVPWHTKLARMAGLTPDAVESQRSGDALPDEKLNALHEFTKSMARTRGSIAPADLKKFLAAGYTPQNALEVVLGIANKVVSNYTAALTEVPLDSAVERFEWRKPSLSAKP
ncbi:carboxymuconolactone decarboxylase family protein [Ruegeria sp. HKCCD4884]|uniref:carboxymuconolactone decarboxylase family protein n=1 Tax=Ruegeria sp. HKCCD4884 TaxID=2683022 RepID=UPI0014916638|nr:carboxymuconolactone decarboxylase family protein [Ruegeria sp. HKCCD4884]NOD94359.1 carboxymuconolactone decarboxylase family protein [Ruegeria sp. HKCCD4884]